MGFEGANVIFDTWIHPLVMGLEEHLLHMFREDFEFHDAAGASHHGGKAQDRITEADAPQSTQPAAPDLVAPEAQTGLGTVIWLQDAERELKKIPFFVRGKARRNTEAYAAERGVEQISVTTLYEAKAHYA